MDKETRPTPSTYIGFPEVPNCSILFQSIDHRESGRAKANGVPDRKMEAGESSQRQRTRNGDEGNNIKSERSIEVLQSERGRKLMHCASERRRRDRIRKRINTLKELIPDCNKTGDAEIFEAAAEYMKSMQLQIQMMSMGYFTSRNPMEVYHGVPWSSPVMQMNQPQWTYRPDPSQALTTTRFSDVYGGLPMIRQPMQYFNPVQQFNLR